MERFHGEVGDSIIDIIVVVLFFFLQFFEHLVATPKVLD